MKELSWAIIGTGRFGQIHAEVVSQLPDVRLTAICNRSVEKLSETCEHFEVADVYTDAAELLASSVDVVTITTHWQEHYELARMALEAGKHVFLEKPMAKGRAECERLMAVAEQATGKFMVGHICRFDPRVAEARKLILAGRIGRVVSMHAKRNLPVAPGSVRLDKISPLMGDGVHDADLMMWFLNAIPSRVYGRTIRVHNHRYPDIGWAVLEFDDQAVGVVETNWSLPESTPTVIDAQFEIIGSAGQIQIDCSATGLSVVDDVRLRRVDTDYWPSLYGRRVGVLRDELEYFADCIRQDRPIDVIRTQEAVRAVAVMEAAEEAARTGRIVDLKGLD